MRNWKEYLNQEKKCTCGRTHLCDIEDIIIKEGAVLELPSLVAGGGYHNICIITDVNTELAAGIIVKQVLQKNQISYSEIMLKGEDLTPDEYVLGSIMVEIPSKCDLILAVGAGTINDLCKFVSFKINIDYFIIASAPSVDGFASNVSCLITNHLKTTYEVGKPKVIIGDLDILAEAPMSLITSGVGDILGKYVCLADWKLSNIVTGEYYCPYVVGLVEESIDSVVNAIGKITTRDKEAVASVMEGLVLSGIAMSYIGNSRPASGSEHHLSHYWEMMFLLNGSHGAWHGTKVAVGTVIGLMLYHQLPELLQKIKDLSVTEFHEDEWRTEIQRLYGISAQEVILLEQRVHKNRNEEVSKRVDMIKNNIEEIKKIEQVLPKVNELVDLLQSLQAPYLPEQIHVDEQMLIESIIYGKELRNRYGILQFLFDIQQLTALAEKIPNMLII